MRDVQADAMEELEVGSELQLLVDLRLEEAVAELIGDELSTSSNRIRLVLGAEARTLSGRAL